MKHLGNGRTTRMMHGAAAGLVGTAALQGLRAASQRYFPTTVPRFEEDPGDYVVQESKTYLPKKLRQHISPTAEKTAAKVLAVGYGMTVGSLFGLLRLRRCNLLQGALLGSITWAIGYLGWLPHIGVVKPVQKQKAQQVAGPLVRHLAYGLATAAICGWLSRKNED